MVYSLATLWHDRNRFLPGVLAVAFSGLLIMLQSGLLLGLFSLTSTPIDHAGADVWVGHPTAGSLELGRPISERWVNRVAMEPEVTRSEAYLQAFAVLRKPDGGSELCTVIGTRLDDDALGAVRQLTPALRERLAEPGAIVVDESELGRLGLSGVGDVAEVFGHRVRLVGVVQGLKSLAAPYLFCSLRTARLLCEGLPGHQTVYVLARCRSADEAAALAERLRADYDVAAFTSGEFSTRTRLHWLLRTKAGIAGGWTVVLGLIVGAVITSQTLYAATMASRREYAVLRALGVPRRRIAGAVLAQAFWVGGAGVLLALPAAFGMAELLGRLGVHVLLPGWILAAAAALTLAMAVCSGLISLRSLRRMEPVDLLR
ncbi:MAG TPA: ABC transporter permease [Gemmataceae bacterium]|nr:ABC transporter permease [Gemmataceae bacterium]